jgi:Ca2+-binding RTX toxin-like protein
MRRVMLMVAAMAIMVSLFAAAAYAADIWGTDANDTLLESKQDDKIFGRQGDDDIFATIYSGDKDVVEGNRHDDIIRVDDGDNQDTAIGGEGFDKCWGDGGDELDCEKVNGAPNPF